METNFLKTRVVTKNAITEYLRIIREICELVLKSFRQCYANISHERVKRSACQMILISVWEHAFHLKG